MKCGPRKTLLQPNTRGGVGVLFQNIGNGLCVRGKGGYTRIPPPPEGALDPPSVTEAQTDKTGNYITLSFDFPVFPMPTPDEFTVTGLPSTGYVINGVSNINYKSIQLQLNKRIQSGDTVLLSYTESVVDNNMVDFVDQAVTNNAV